MAVLTFDNYAALKLTIAGWLNRSDQAILDAIPAFIILAEKEIARVLRRSSLRATIIISGEATTLPGTAAELRSVRLSSSSGGADVPLDVGTPEMLAEYKARYGGSAGRPRAAAMIGGKLVVAPAPDGAYNAEVVYYLALVPLSDSNPTNLVLVEAPDAYLYGALAAAAPFLEHDERAATWTPLFEKAINQLHLVRENEEFGASLRPMRLPVVFGE